VVSGPSASVQQRRNPTPEHSWAIREQGLHVGQGEMSAGRSQDQTTDTAAVMCIFADSRIGFQAAADCRVWPQIGVDRFGECWRPAMALALARLRLSPPRMMCVRSWPAMRCCWR
jgi:hypothetical protein